MSSLRNTTRKRILVVGLELDVAICESCSDGGVSCPRCAHNIREAARVREQFQQLSAALDAWQALASTLWVMVRETINE